MLKKTNKILLILYMFFPTQLIAMQDPQFDNERFVKPLNCKNQKFKMVEYRYLIKQLITKQHERIKLFNVYPLYMADNDFFQVLTSLVDKLGSEAIEAILIDFALEKFPLIVPYECTIKALHELLDVIDASPYVRKLLNDALDYYKNKSVKIAKPFSRKHALNPAPLLSISPEQFIDGITSRDALRFAQVTPAELREFLQGARTKNITKLLDYGQSTIAWIAYQIVSKTSHDTEELQNLSALRRWADIGLGLLLIKNYWGAFQVAKALELAEGAQKLMSKKNGKPKKYKALFRLLMADGIREVNEYCVDPNNADKCLPIISVLIDDIVTGFSQHECSLLHLSLRYRDFRASIGKCHYQIALDEDIAKFISDFSVMSWDHSVITELIANQEQRLLNNDLSFEETPLELWNCYQLMSFLRKSRCEVLIPKFLAQKIWSGRNLLALLMSKGTLRSNERLNILMRKGFTEWESRTILHRFFNGVNSPRISNDWSLESMRADKQH